MSETRAGGSPARRGPGELESEILSLLWTSPTAMGAGAVQERLSGDLAYTTVVTILSRLHDKGVLRRTRSGRSYAYSPVYDEAGLAARRMRQVLDKEGDRQAVLSRFVSDLSTDDEALLRRLLESEASQASDVSDAPDVFDASDASDASDVPGVPDVVSDASRSSHAARMSQVSDRSRDSQEGGS